MKEFLARLSSRKFLLTVAALATLAANRNWDQFVVVLLGYLGVQGGTDVVASLKSPTKQLGSPEK